MIYKYDAIFYKHPGLILDFGLHPIDSFISRILQWFFVNSCGVLNAMLYFYKMFTFHVYIVRLHVGNAWFVYIL